MDGTSWSVVGNGEIITSSKDYSTRLLTNLNKLRTQSQLCDVELICGLDGGGGEKVYGHRNVLAAASPYFNAMFTGGLIEQRRESVVIQSMNTPTLKGLLNFIYTGEICVSRDNVQEILIAGDMIELGEVVDICTNYLIRELDPTNAIGIFRFASDHNCISLKKVSKEYIHEKFVDVSQESEEFRDIPQDLLMEFLGSEHLRVDCEYQVFLAAMNWINADIRSRRRFIFDVLKYIRLPLVPSKLLESYVNDVSDISVKVALGSVKKDLIQRKGSLVTLSAVPRLCAKKNIYVIGGCQRELGSAWTKSECTYQSVEMYDTFHKKWKQVRPMRIGRILPGLAVLNGRIYVAGGEIDSEILANGEVYDPNEDTWVEMAAMTIPRCEFGMCAFNGFIYAFGGWVGEDIGGSIERYDPLLNTWTTIAKMQEPRFSMGIFSFQGLIYLVGGCTHTRRHMQELVSYNPVTGEWTSYSNMIYPRSQMGCAVLANYLYVVGGTNRHNEVLQSVERYSFKENRWEIIPNMMQPRASPSVAASNGKLYVFGGDQINEVNFYRARTTISSAECYDPLTNSWTDSEALPDSRSEAGAVVL